MNSHSTITGNSHPKHSLAVINDDVSLMGRKRLSQALELEEKPENRYLRLSLYCLAGAVVIFIPWAALTPIIQVVHASGEVMPEGQVNVVQHLEGGLVEKVLVQDGDQVRKGQLLLQLRPNLLESEYKAMQQQLGNLESQQKQLRASLAGEDSIGQTTSEVQKAQQDLLTTRLNNAKDQISAVEAQVAQKTAEISRFDQQERKFQLERALSTEQVEMYRQLTGSGAGSRLSLVNARQQLASLNTKLAELQGDRQISLRLRSEAEAKLRSLKSGLRLEENSQIAASVSEEAVINENIKKVRNQLERTSIVSPVNGRISDLRYKAPGGVIAPGAVVTSVVPVNTTLIAEARIPSRDIGFVRTGQKVDIKLQPFDSTIYGSVPGSVLSISPSTVQDPDDRRYYYKARIQLKRQYMEINNNQLPVQVGMPLVADIQGPQRSVLRYIFQPFTRTMNNAFRESI